MENKIKTSDLDISWVEKSLIETEKIIKNVPFNDHANAYLAGVHDFKNKALEDIMSIEDRLYEDSDQTTPKELLWEIKGIIEKLKAE